MRHLFKDSLLLFNKIFKPCCDIEKHMRITEAQWFLIVIYIFKLTRFLHIEPIKNMLTLLHCSNFLTLNSLDSFYAIFGLLLSWSQYLKKPHSTPIFKSKKFKVHSPPSPLTITFHVFHWLLGSLLLRNIKNCLDKSSQNDCSTQSKGCWDNQLVFTTFSGVGTTV